MVHRYVSWLLAAALLFLLPWRGQAQTVLQAGDLAFVGYNAQDPDDYAFTPLVDLAPGTQIRFTDNG